MRLNRRMKISPLVALGGALLLVAATLSSGNYRNDGTDIAGTAVAAAGVST